MVHFGRFSLLSPHIPSRNSAHAQSRAVPQRDLRTLDAAFPKSGYYPEVLTKSLHYLILCVLELLAVSSGYRERFQWYIQ